MGRTQTGWTCSTGCYPPGSLLWENHLYAHGHRRLGPVSGIREQAGLRMDAEDDDVAAVLIGDEQETAGRIDAEVAWRLAPGGHMVYGSEPTGLRIDGEDSDAVVAAVGAV